MKIMELVCENVKRLSVVEIRPDGNLVQICGPNGSGKTSVLDAIAWALQGASGVQSQPIRKGAKNARIRIDLGDLIVTRRFSEHGSTLTVENKEGLVHKTPQAILDRLMGSIAFDPLAFARQRPREQFDTLRSLVKVDLDFAAIERDNAADFSKRTELNREAKAKRAQAVAMGSFPADLPAEKIDTEPLITRIADAGRHNADIEREKERRQATLTQAEKLRAAAAEQRSRATELRRQAEEEEGCAARNEQRAAEAAEEVKSALPLPAPIDPLEVRNRLRDAEVTNANIERRNQQAATIEKARKLEAEAEALTARMSEREQAKRDAIAAAKMPVEGLGFGDGQVTLNGVPFEQGSDAEQLRASCAIAMAANPKLRVLRIRDGSLLDENGLRLLAEMADAHDYQVWIERVDTSGKVGVVLEDGHVRRADAPDDATVPLGTKEAAAEAAGVSA